MALDIPENKVIPILAYHKVTPGFRLDPDNITIKKFHKQMEFLYNQGFYTVTGQDLIRQPFVLTADDKRFLISLDDGYCCIKDHIAPVLKKFGFKAIIFPITHYIGKMNLWDTRSRGKVAHLSNTDLVKLGNEGFEIGSHTINHYNLTNLSNSMAYKELKGSKDFLENLLGKQVYMISYPFGQETPRIQELALKAGYQIGISIHKNTKSFNIMAIRSWGIYPWESRASIEGKLRDSAYEEFKLKFIHLGSAGAGLL
ncbi:polysaccharide deacetylase family protein, partial [bacterium]|nr:polysaccharide deacetylase family protein [bacterium]